MNGCGRTGPWTLDPSHGGHGSFIEGLGGFVLAGYVTVGGGPKPHDRVSASLLASHTGHRLLELRVTWPGADSTGLDGTRGCAWLWLYLHEARTQEGEDGESQTDLGCSTDPAPLCPGGSGMVGCPHPASTLPPPQGTAPSVHPALGPRDSRVLAQRQERPHSSVRWPSGGSRPKVRSTGRV